MLLLCFSHFNHNLIICSIIFLILWLVTHCYVQSITRAYGRVDADGSRYLLGDNAGLLHLLVITHERERWNICLCFIMFGIRPTECSFSFLTVKCSKVNILILFGTMLQSNWSEN